MNSLTTEDRAARIAKAPPARFRFRTGFFGRQILQVDVSHVAHTAWDERVHVEQWRDATKADRERYEAEIAAKGGA